MKHRLAFAALLATPLIATTVHAEATDSFTPTTLSVYDTIQVDLSQIVGTVESYSWSVIDGTSKPVAGLKGNSFAVKPEHAGKIIEVTAYLKDGEKITSATFINPLIIDWDGSAIFATQTGAKVEEAFEGLTLQAQVPKVVMPTYTIEGDFLNTAVPATDVVYTYTWYKVASNAKEKLSTTVASYTIPETFRKGITGDVSIEVEVKATIKGAAGLTPITTSVRIPIGESPVDKLVENIDKLFVPVTATSTYYAYNLGTSTLAQFKENVTTLQQQVNGLPGNLKTQITNATHLQTAQANILSAENFASLAATAKDTKKIEDIEKAKKAGSNLNQLQLSLVQREYNELFQENTSSDTLAEEEIKKLNAALVDLYTFTSLEDIEEELARLNEELAALPRQFHGLVNAEHLTRTQQNINAVRNFYKKFQLISPAAEEITSPKDIRAAETAYNTYTKLTHEQALLVEEDDLTFIFNVLTSEKQLADEVFAGIDEIVQNALDGEYTTTADILDMQQDIEALFVDYKALSTKSKKLVTNYPKLQELRKAVKDAARAETQIMKLAQYDAALNAKTAKAKLLATQKSILKLTPLAHMFVTNKEDLESANEAVINAFALVNNVPLSALATEFEADIAEWDVHGDYLTYGDFESFSEFESTVGELNKKFKAISSRERNTLMSKVFITSATSDVKAVKNAMKKITAALSESNESKKYTRLLSAERAFAKLSSTQQNLLKLPYKSGDEKSPYTQMIEEKQDVIDISSFDDKLNEFKREGYTEEIEDLQAFVNAFNSLNNSVKKLVLNESMVKGITKDIKKVNDFLIKYGTIIEDIDSATPIQKNAFLSAYTKLTFLQHSLLDEEIADIVEEIRSEHSLESTSTLFNDIASLIQNGVYTDKATLENIARFKEQYKLMSTDERRVISNYDVVLTAEKHIEKINALIALKPADLTTPDGIAWMNKTTALKPLEASLFTHLLAAPVTPETTTP